MQYERRVVMKLWQVVVALVLVSFVGCASLEGIFEDEETVPLSEVPAKVKAAASNAVKGIELTEAEVEREDDRVVYELEGEANGKEYEIEVTADGEVLEVEEEED